MLTFMKKYGSFVFPAFLLLRIAFFCLLFMFIFKFLNKRNN